MIHERKESLKDEQEFEKIQKKRHLDFLDILLCAKVGADGCVAHLGQGEHSAAGKAIKCKIQPLWGCHKPPEVLRATRAIRSVKNTIPGPAQLRRD